MRLPVRQTSDAPQLDALETLLSRRLRGEVRFGQHDLGLYSTDASVYQVMPLGVVVPADESDAQIAVQCCAELAVPILPRGGGTSLAGQCTNRAVVLDL
jgi:FAD/FMN-containing dehydrogenase